MGISAFEQNEQLTSYFVGQEENVLENGPSITDCAMPGAPPLRTLCTLWTPEVLLYSTHFLVHPASGFSNQVP
jgi:hypothetical protein